MEVTRGAAAEGGQVAELITKVKDTLRRRWITFVLVSGAVFVLGVVLVSLMTPMYTSVARVRIDPSRNPLATGANADQTTLTPEAMETEVTLLSSPDLARAVVRRLGLQNDPEFAGFARQNASTGTMPANEQEAFVATQLLNHLSVSRDKLTYILVIRFTSRDSFKSARIANAFAEAYLDSKVGNGVGTAERQADWFKQRLDSLGAEVRAEDERVAQYRAQAGIVGGSSIGSGTMADQQVGPLSGELATAESDAAAAHSNLEAARRQIASGGLDAVSQVLSSPVIADLRRQRAEVLRSMGEVQARYGDKHPEMIRVRDQLASLDAQIKEESNRVIGSLEAATSAADARAGSLRASMGRLQSERSANTRAAATADSLDRETAAKRAQYDKMSQMSLESTQAASQTSISSADIVEKAQPAPKPTSPNKPLLYALSLIVALACGAGVVAIQELMVTGLRSVDDVESQLGVPLLAAIPKVAKTANPADLLLERPTSLFAESLRIARAAILGVRSGASPQVIAITSALPAEGKTTTALAFARTLATNGARTLLLECDVRRAALRALVGAPPTGPGIVDILHGEATADEAISPGDVPNLDHLLVRAPYFSSEDLFGGGGMEKLIAELRRHYDLIVLDLPPLVGLADGRFLAVLADVTVMTVRWDVTPATAVSSAIAWLRADGANPVGVIFTLVDSGAEAVGGLYYSKKYAGYYQAAA